MAHLRTAALEDVDKLVKARFDYFTAEKWTVSPEQHAMLESNLREYYAKHLNIDFFAFLMEADGEIISTAFLGITEKPANISIPTGRIGTVYNVLTYPGHRKKGYALSTMKALIDEAKKHNLSYVELSASSMGKPLYQKLGFKEYSSHPFTEMKLSIV